MLTPSLPVWQVAWKFAAHWGLEPVQVELALVPPQPLPLLPPIPAQPERSSQAAAPSPAVACKRIFLFIAA